MWDRSKQNYFILRRGDPWQIINIKTDNKVADYPAFKYNNELIEVICFAENDEKVLKILIEHDLQ